MLRVGHVNDFALRVERPIAASTLRLGLGFRIHNSQVVSSAYCFQPVLELSGEDEREKVRYTSCEERGA